MNIAVTANILAFVSMILGVVFSLTIVHLIAR
jgi:hypothetical protein